MSTGTETQSAAVATVALTPVLSERFALRWQHAAVCVGFCMLFVYLSYIPLFHTETWRHAYYGQYMIQHGSLPATDPALPLAEGMEQVATSWLSQVAIASLEYAYGAEAMTYLLAASQIAALTLLAVAFYRLSRSTLFMSVGIIYVVLMWWGQLAILRPQIFGALCLSALLCTLTFNKRRASRPLWAWLAVPVIMMLWANLDGSFVAGVAVLACLSAGTAIDLWRKTRSVTTVVTSKAVRQSVWLFELGLLATLVNPFGIDLWGYALRMENNPLWLAAGGWRPLTLARWLGCGFTLFWAAMLILLRRVNQPIRTSSVLLLLVASVGVICNELLIHMFAPIAVFAAMPYTKALVDQHSKSTPRPTTELRPIHFMYTLLCGLSIWAAFALSPISKPVLGGKPRQAEQLYSSQTPLGVSKHFQQSPPDSMVCAPQHWGDWLAWDAEQPRAVVANSHMYLLPQQVRTDYDRIYAGEAGWERILDRYAVRVLVVDKERHPRLADIVIRPVKGWSITYEDDLAMVLRRKPQSVPGGSS